MDAIDRKIVYLLSVDGRLSHEQIGRAVNLSRPAIHERVRRLEEQGIIRGYRAIVDWGALGQPITAFIWVRTAGVKCNETGQEILCLSCAEAVVEECHRVTGEWCMLLKVRVASPLALQDLIDRIRIVPGVKATLTNIALSTISEDGAPHGATRGELAGEPQ